MGQPQSYLEGQGSHAHCIQRQSLQSNMRPRSYKTPPAGRQCLGCYIAPAQDMLKLERMGAPSEAHAPI